MENHGTYDKLLKISDYEAICLRRLGDNTVEVSIDDSITGTTTRLAYYKNGVWKPYNTPNFEKLFSLFRKHEHLQRKLFRFLTPIEVDSVPTINDVTKVVGGVKKWLIVTSKSVHRSAIKQLQ